MLYSFEDRENLEKIEELAFLQNQVKVVRLQDKLNRQNFHEDMKKYMNLSLKLLEMSLKR